MTGDREVALSFMRALWAGDMEAADALLADRAVWLFQLGMPQAKLPGRGRTWPAREAMRRIVDDLFGKFDPEGFTVTLDRVIGDSGVIAIEYEARGRTAGGAGYQNYYVTTLTVQHGKVTEVRPYNDTAHMVVMLA